MSVVAWDEMEEGNVRAGERKSLISTGLYLAGIEQRRWWWCEELKQPNIITILLRIFFYMQHTQWIIHELSVWHNVEFFAREQRRLAALVHVPMEIKFIASIENCFFLHFHSSVLFCALRPPLANRMQKWNFGAISSRVNLLQLKLCWFTRIKIGVLHVPSFSAMHAHRFSLYRFYDSHDCYMTAISTYILHTLDSTFGSVCITSKLLWYGSFFLEGKLKMLSKVYGSIQCRFCAAALWLDFTSLLGAEIVEIVNWKKCQQTCSFT